MFEGTKCRFDELAKGADPLFVGVVPMPGKSLHLSPARQVTSLDGCFGDLIWGVSACCEERMGRGEGHEVGVEIF